MTFGEGDFACSAPAESRRTTPHLACLFRLPASNAIAFWRPEIDAMSDREQMATLVELPAFFRPAARESLLKVLTKHLGDERDNAA